MKELERDSDNNLSKWGGKWLPFPFKMKLPLLDESGEIIPGSEEDGEEEDLISEITGITDKVDENGNPIKVKNDEHAREGYAYFYKKIEDIKDTEFYY